MGYSQAEVENKAREEADRLTRKEFGGNFTEGGDTGGKQDSRYNEYYQTALTGAGNDERMVVPGAGEYGGDAGSPGAGVKFYKDQAIAGGKTNDAAQAANESAMKSSWANMTADRPGPGESAGLSQNATNTRFQQTQALDLSRAAAEGRAPSEADYQTRIGMNDAMAANSSAQGSARGLGALSGAQAQGAAATGQSMGNLSVQGGLARSKEIGDAIGMYGTQAGTVRDQDLSRLGINSKNAMFNAKANDDWKLGNANLLASQGQLGNTQAGTDLAWAGEAQRGTDKQFQYDQEMAAVQAGADADKVGAAIAANRESKENRRQLVNGGISAGLTAGGGAIGGPIGAAAGQGAGAAWSSATKDWDW